MIFAYHSIIHLQVMKGFPPCQAPGAAFIGLKRSCDIGYSTTITCWLRGGILQLFLFLWVKDVKRPRKWLCDFYVSRNVMKKYANPAALANEAWQQSREGKLKKVMIFPDVRLVWWNLVSGWPSKSCSVARPE